MDCGDARERLTAFLDGELQEAERGDIERHLSSCPGCASALREMQAVVGFLGAWTVDSAATDGSSSRLVERVLSARPARPARPPLPSTGRWWAAAGVAAAILGFAAGLWFEIPRSPASGSRAPDLAADLHPLPIDPSILEGR